FSRISWHKQADHEVIEAFSHSLKDFSKYLDQLNQLSKLKNFSQKEQTCRTIHLNEFIRSEVLNKLSNLVDKKSLYFDLQIPESLSIWTNAEVLRHILYNLLLNACQHSPENESIT